MEERTPPAGNGKNNIKKLSTATSLRLAPPSDRSSDTYVVQIPRDQVYRVPPPENAKIVESHRTPDNNFQRKRKFGCCCWILLGLLVFGIIIGVTIGVIHVLYIPKCPNFSVVGVNFKNVTDPSSGHGQKNQPQQHPKFDIDLKVNNVNERMDVSFGEGKTNFVFKKHDIGQGKYPSNSQKAKGTNNVHLNLDVGSNGKLPSDLLKSLEDDKKPIVMTLMINHVPMEIKSWVKILKKDLTITCDFDVQDLTKKSKIMPNECITDF
ncbi:NDR1/HIN1-like protein 13 [Lycium ferocissimum]|uniref:NDR1/HIN1-like protein 13 n=1 Tax=Lycium ferocissimum TaxID=112874 RepID=UPI0028152CAE|nr:NDR1/HIN1-like protein 13 [Lycium ferocissimum]